MYIILKIGGQVFAALFSDLSLGSKRRDSFLSHCKIEPRQIQFDHQV